MKTVDIPIAQYNIYRLRNSCNCTAQAIYPFSQNSVLSYLFSYPTPSSKLLHRMFTIPSRCLELV